VTRSDGVIRTALITGAGRGIGRATASRLARDGVRIALNFKSDREAATEAKRLVEACGSTAMSARMARPSES